LFEVQARRLKLLRLKAGRSESDKFRLMPEMESLPDLLPLTQPVPWCSVSNVFFNNFQEYRAWMI
jgi:hypothetical protein